MDSNSLWLTRFYKDEDHSDKSITFIFIEKELLWELMEKIPH